MPIFSSYIILLYETIPYVLIWWSWEWLWILTLLETLWNQQQKYIRIYQGNFQKATSLSTSENLIKMYRCFVRLQCDRVTVKIAILISNCHFHNFFFLTKETNLHAYRYRRLGLAELHTHRFLPVVQIPIVNHYHRSAVGVCTRSH